ncbi:MAG: hypothetical protein LWX51_17135 [Deltaproteobacteria bacterium]|nr:hypothetical protein [Deltaproteobacteria bacterium]
MVHVTKGLKAAGEALGINLLDHIVFNHKGYCSLPGKRRNIAYLINSIGRS